MVWRWDPFNEIFDIYRDIDNLFRRTLAEFGLSPFSEVGSRRMLPSTTSLLSSPSWLPTTAAGAFVPALEAYVQDGKFIVRCEVPGIDPEKLEVTVTGNQLRICGEKAENKEVSQGNFYVRETSHGRFERTITLPEGVKTSDIKANYHNGVLEISMPAEGLAHQKVRIEISEPKQLKSAA